MFSREVFREGCGGKTTMGSGRTGRQAWDLFLRFHQRPSRQRTHFREKLRYVKLPPHLRIVEDERNTKFFSGLDA